MLDSNIFIQWWIDRYPLDLFPSIWATLENEIASGRAISPMEVFDELKEKDDDLLSWVKPQKLMFKEPTEDVQVALAEVLEAHPRLVDSTKGRSRADPWVIAQAMVCEGTVVTYENPSKGKVPKIPDACNDLKVDWINGLDYLYKIGFSCS